MYIESYRIYSFVVCLSLNRIILKSIDVLSIDSLFLFIAEEEGHHYIAVTQFVNFINRYSGSSKA